MLLLSAVFQLGFRHLVAVGARGGGWGVMLAVILAGFLFAVIFTVIYDGRRALVRLFRREPV